MKAISSYLRGFSSRAVHVLILIGLAVPYSINLGTSSIWDASEAYYAETSREMLESGDHLAPRFNFSPRTQKPPLTYWVLLISYRIFGVSEFSVRLPCAIAAIGVVLFCYGSGRALYNPRVALAAAVISATTPRMYVLSRRLPIDMLLLFFLTGAFFFLLRGIQSRKRIYWASAYLFMGAGFLTKGPVAVLLPAGAYLIWALWNRRLRIAGIFPFTAITVLAAVILPWYIQIYRVHGWTYIQSFFLKDNLGRYLSEPFGPARGPLYYLSVFGLDFFPWSILLVAALVLLWTGRRKWTAEDRLSMGLPLIWCCFIFLVFSISKNKQEYYIAPMYPVAALVLAAVLDRSRILFPWGRSRENAGNAVVASYSQSGSAAWKWISLFVGFLLLFLAPVLLLFFRGFMPDVAPWIQYGPSVTLFAAAAAITLCVARKMTAACFPVTAAAVWSLFLFGSLFILPALEAFRPVKSFCETIRSRAPEKATAGSFGITLPSMVFYLRQPVFEEYDQTRMAGKFQSDERVFCVLTSKDYALFSGDKDLKLQILDRRPHFSLRLDTIMNAGYSPDEELLLVSNSPS